ncbi:MAG: lysoplasmalogenase [Anaerolineales bacterium]|nr:lysoplasmalogenase [Anaerolineales bacterium]
MIPGLIIVLAVAVVDWIAVAKGWKKVEYLAKPWTMAALFLVLALVGRFSSLPLIFFGLGILFSLAGDVFLMFSDRWFIPGLVSFLLAHVAYIAGFNIPLPVVSPTWALVVALVLAFSAARLLRRIVAGLAAKGERKLISPVVVYGVVITLMLLSAMLTLFRADWPSPTAAALAAFGAMLFFYSDAILAWIKFVAPVKNGRMMNMITYHLGQIALIAGVLIQFAG